MTVINFSDYNPVDSDVAKAMWFGFTNQGPGLYKATDPSTEYEYIGNISSYDLVIDGAPRSHGRVTLGSIDCYQIIYDSEGIGNIRIFKI